MEVSSLRIWNYLIRTFHLYLLFYLYQFDQLILYFLYKKYSLRHFLEWNIIKHYKNLGFNYYCLGHSFYFSTGLREEIDDKHRRIGLLKTKFGGDQYPEHFFRIYHKNNNLFGE